MSEAAAEIFHPGRGISPAPARFGFGGAGLEDEWKAFPLRMGKRKVGPIRFYRDPRGRHRHLTVAWGWGEDDSPAGERSLHREPIPVTGTTAVHALWGSPADGG